MGRVSAFAGMVLYMYPEKGGQHKRPHLHATYGDEECVLSIPDGNWKLCMEGKDVIFAALSCDFETHA